MPFPIAAAVVFVSSAAVLVTEILAGRLMAPYVGVTLETFTGIIGVILAGIALGSWLGGRAADRVDARLLLGPVVAVGGGLTVASLPLLRSFGAVGLGGSPIAIVVLATVSFFLPAAVLSAVTPIVVKIQLDSLEETGRVVGRLSAVGTAGALFGTFTTGFVLVAAFPSAPVVITVGCGLVAVGVALWLWLGRGAAGRGALVWAAALAVGGGLLGAVLASPCQVETAYFCGRVVVDEARAGGRTLVLDRLRHSYVDLDDPTHLELTYAQTIGDVVDSFRPPGEPVDALHIGGGGFTLPRYLAATRPGSDSLVLELDPSLVDLARDELGLVLGPALRVATGDARINLQSEPDDSSDLVIGDAFGGQAVPWHLTTRELVADVQRVLRPDGVYVINLIDYPPLGFARAEVATLRAVFDHVAVLAPPERIAGTEGGNFILVGSDAPLDTEAMQAANDARGDDEVVISTAAELDAFAADAEVLTDAHAPVDQLLTPLY